MCKYKTCHNVITIQKFEIRHKFFKFYKLFLTSSIMSNSIGVLCGGNILKDPTRVCIALVSFRFVEWLELPVRD